MTKTPIYILDELGYLVGKTHTFSIEHFNPSDYFWTEIEPIECPAGKCLRFVSAEWVLEDDNLGKLAWIGTTALIISYRGNLRNGETLTKPQSVIDIEARIAFKENRTAIVDALTVEEDGLVYDANEKAQMRMLNAINVAVHESSSVIPFWVMADNTPAFNIPLENFRNAHAKAFLAMGAVWLPS